MSIYAEFLENRWSVLCNWKALNAHSPKSVKLKNIMSECKLNLIVISKCDGYTIIYVLCNQVAAPYYGHYISRFSLIRCNL